MARNRRGQRMLAHATDEERALALLSAVCGRQVPPHVMHHIRRASDWLRNDDHCLAQIELAFAPIPRLESREDGFRLFLADDLLIKGLSPRRLMRALGFDPRLLKYDPNQPRVPAGNGRRSGEWGSIGRPAQIQTKQNNNPTRNGEATSAPVAAIAAGASVEAGTLGSGLFTADAATSFLVGLASLAAAVGTGLVLGALIVFRDSHEVQEGTLPGDQDLHYRFTGAQPTLEIWRQGAAGREQVYRATRVGDIFYEPETGIPIARLVGKSVVFDAQSLASVLEQGRSENDSDTAEQDKPQLCPDPGPDAPHGASARAIAYQAFVSAFNNPQRPLPPGMAVSLVNPKTGRRVIYDDCREIDGVMLEAKGPGYAKLLRSNYMKDVLKKRWINQGERQVNAAGWRGNEWWFAEEGPRVFAEQVFEKNGLNKIHTVQKEAPPLPGDVKGAKNDSGLR
jgi:hypothetical protein